MKHFFGKTLFYFILACGSFVACKDGAFDFSNSSVKIDGEWGVALVNAEAAFKDFTIDSALSILSDNEIVKIVYSVPLQTSGSLEELLPAHDYQWDFAITGIDEPAATPRADTIIFWGEQDILFYGDTSQILADTAVFNAGKFQLIMNNTLDHSFKFKIKSKYFHYADGKTLDTLIEIPYNANNFAINIDLTGCQVKLKRNSLPCEIALIAYNDGHTFSGNKKNIQVDVSGTLYIFKLLQGKVRSFSDKVTAESDFSLNSGDKMSFNVQNIRDGKIRINSYNGFGCGVKINIDSCNLITDGILSHLLSPADAVIAFEPSTTHYMIKNQSFSIPLNNFSIAGDNAFRLAASVCVNEPGMAGADVWVADNSSFSIEPSLEIPLDFNLNYFIYRDTFAQEISKIENIDFADNLTVRIELINDFPIELTAQLYFLDGNFHIIDSLFPTAMFINAARTNPADGKIITSGKMNKTPLFIEINDARLDKIYHTKYICVYAKAASNNQQAIVRSDHKLKIKVGAKVKIKATLK